MKKLILIAVVLFVGLGLYSQNKIVIKKTDGTLDSYLMTSVDSIYHNLSEDTMFVKNSDGLFSFALSEVDSVYFIIIGQVNGADGKVYTFMNHNLGADYTADPLIPDRKLNGAYYQWGRKDSVAYAPTSTDDDPGVVGTWDESHAPDDSWKDDEKTANDPCPSGFRVPTSAQWAEIRDNNTWTAVGDWTNSNSNYSSGYEIKPDGTNATMFLPASGRRYGTLGELNIRGSNGLYWSTTHSSTVSVSYYLHFGSSVVKDGANGRNLGHSVRCLAE